MKKNAGVLAILLAGCTACTELPLMPIPAVPLATAYKEVQDTHAGAAADGAAASRLPPQSWWAGFQDPELDALERQLVQHNPDLASALAHYQQARAASDVVRAEQSPTVGTSLDMRRDRQSERRPLRVLGANSPDVYDSATLGLDFEYEIDLWGRVRQQVNAGVADEQAGKADLAAARLSLQAQLADTLIALRGLDQQAVLLRDTVAAYRRASDMLVQRHDHGIVSGLDLARGQAQLESARSQVRQVQAQRALLEHAIAALVGANASNFSIEARDVPAALPTIPLGMPSVLLLRRPDIAAAQLRVSAAGARVGVARTAFFPSLSLNGGVGLQSSDLARFAEMPNLYWALGPTLAVTLFDGGRRRAQVAGAEAQLEEAGHRYRAVVLAAFQQVEDQLALLNQYGEAAKAERQGALFSERTLALATQRYQLGAVSYLEVVTAQTSHLLALRSALDLDTRHRRAAVQLVRALGGGWTAAQLATQSEPQSGAQGNM